ncbi:hypothetical protein D3C83_144440 [compost metagenome]
MIKQGLTQEGMVFEPALFGMEGSDEKSRPHNPIQHAAGLCSLKGVLGQRFPQGETEAIGDGSLQQAVARRQIQR